jgi:MyTH4 domain
MIKMAVKNSAELRDEVFFQLIKQVRANNKQDCCYQAWSLLSVVSCFICPSESSIYYLLNYIKFMIDNFRDDEVKRSAKFVFVRLLKGYLTRGRGVLPCSAEIDLIRKKQKLSCRINLFTNGYLTVYFENYTVISDILKQICHMMEIDKEHFSKFGLLEVTTKPGMQVEETFVEEFIKLADVLASWEHEKLFYQRKTGISFESKFELYFKIRFYFPLEKSVFRDSLLLYNEVVKALSVLLHL